MTLHHALTKEIRDGPSGPKVGAFFDLDQTLLAGFSATAFFRERLLSGRIAPGQVYDAVLGALSFGLGRAGFSSLMTGVAAAFRGMEERALDEIGEEIFEKRLATSIYPESRALVSAHQEMGHTLAVVSSATRYQTGPVARDLGIGHVACTQLEVYKGRFTGRVIKPTCYGEGKAEAVRTLAHDHDLDLTKSYFYSDSHDDLPPLEIVGKPRPLNPNRRLAQVAKERDWPVRRFHSRGMPSVSDIARTAMVYGSVIPSAWAGLAAGVLNQSRREGVNLLGSMWGDLATSLAGVDLRVEGEEHLWSHRPAVFIFNHQSNLDALLMIKLLRRDMTGIGKQELRWAPLLGPLLQVAGLVFIDRSDTARAIEAMKPAARALREGLSLVIAPEGTRSPTPHLGPFKKGAFHIAMQTGAPIVPVVFRNSLDALPKSALIVRPASIEAVVLPPIDTSGWKRENLTEEVRAVRDLYLEILEKG
jgi:putative phosphoserine phosphatase/1-acylglycerol-3-phosphate O-acyltransferase